MTKKKQAHPISPEPVAAPTQPLTPAMQIWNDIKDKTIDMFGLPGQTVSQYCQMGPAIPSKLYLTYKVGSVITAIENAFRNRYDIAQVDKYLILSHKTDYPTV